MSVLPIPTELVAGTWGDAYRALLTPEAKAQREPMGLTVSLSVADLDGPPAPGDLAIGVQLAGGLANSLHAEKPRPMHLAGLAYEVLLTPADVRAVVDAYPADDPDAGRGAVAWRATGDQAIAILRDEPKAVAFACIVLTTYCPHSPEPTE